MSGNLGSVLGYRLRAQQTHRVIGECLRNRVWGHWHLVGPGHGAMLLPVPPPQIIGRRGQDKEVTSKERIVARSSSFGRWQESIRQITSLVLTFQTDWFKILLLGEVETVFKLGVKSWFDVG